MVGMSTAPRKLESWGPYRLIKPGEKPASRPGQCVCHSPKALGRNGLCVRGFCPGLQNDILHGLFKHDEICLQLQRPVSGIDLRHTRCLEAHHAHGAVFVDLHSRTFSCKIYGQ